MRIFSSKRSFGENGNESINKIRQEEEVFYKVSRTFTDNFMKPSQYKEMISNIHAEMKRPETSKKLKSDYGDLLNYIKCNERITESRQRSMMTYKKIRNISKANLQKKKYEPLYREIQNGEENVTKTRNKKVHLEEFQNKMKSEAQSNALVESVFSQGMRDIKNFIPQEAKLNKKLEIFGELLQDEKYEHISKIKSMLERENKKLKGFDVRYQIYLINHYILQELMVKINEDLSALNLKKRNHEIYSLIKSEMVGEVINQKTFADMLTILENYLIEANLRRANIEKPKTADPSKRIKQRVNTGVLLRKKSESFENMPKLIKGKENEIAHKFETLFKETEEKLTEAQNKLTLFSQRHTYSSTEYGRNKKTYNIQI